ncbi:hypothetical_protein [Leishmania infantum]|uniref:Hypothetical_protein n=1 Tax=Leishmania infantum TaxID=5671 RepID=A0A6L0XT60_LEIIN|nr:hypothetical_protein [Leishmania infantum]SUZ46470.1 hypothetical_protein [Leishmania infantum]
MKIPLQSTLFVCLFGTLSALVASVLILGSADMSSVRASQRMARMCGNLGSCIRIHSGPIDSILIGDIDFDRDTVGDVIKRIPPWFGSQTRPLALTVHNVPLKEESTLRAQGLMAASYICLASIKELRVDTET